MSEPSVLVLAGACLLLLGCALVAPLDGVRREASSERCTSARCTDTGPQPAAPTQGDGAVDLAAIHDAAAKAADAGTRDAAEAACVIPPGAECDPIGQCACPASLECGFDPQMLRVRCVAKHTGSKLDGEHCVDSMDCASGLQCDAFNLCARYCNDDQDCGGSGKCRTYRDARTGSIVAAAGWCSRWCDPMSAAECAQDSNCYPGSLAAEDPTATCRSFHSSARKQRGESCIWYNECDRGLMCARFGPAVCTSACKTADDCQPEAPHCYLDFAQPLAATPAQRVGQCTVWPCDSATLPEPKGWTGGPVWTAEQSVQCTTRCGRFNADCYAQNCSDGERWRECWDTTLAACGAAKDAPCRDLYVALVCSELDTRDPAQIDFDTCVEQQTECYARARSTCAQTP